MLDEERRRGRTGSGCTASTSIQTLYVQYMTSDGYNVENARIDFQT